ncbi:oligosaccharide flippase family protein [Nocardioides panacis]|uniref:Oligosaccharide flippase family protein n=1 Tax=Nocardioides panacis TaxID=2849501 RepID=A0A975T0K8_9ACTN|nr:oligosaccharide flippase family protein [Nocardioides panacis]QWZ09418.1 oligosaccharide flippase family protein [Nocardioides panacis]
MNLRTASRDAVRDGAVIALAMVVMNVTTYGFTILAARLLGPVEYGALAAVMGLLLVVNVLSLGLQATGARRVSAAPQDRLGIEHEVMATSYASSLVLGAVLLVASPLIALVLNLDSWVSAALIAATAVPLSVMGGQAGILQGERRWGPLAAIYVAVGVGRLGCGLVALLVRPDTLGAMVGITVGALLPVLIGTWALRHPRRGRAVAGAPRVRTPLAQRWAKGGVLRETFHNSHALLAFFALSNADVIIARTTLDERQAGLYAGGLILTKAVLFLPQFVVVIAFPSMSRAGDDRRAHLVTLTAVLGIGLVAVLGVTVLSALAVVFVGGSEYADLQGLLWGFAVLGTLLSLIQVMVYEVVARQHQRMVLVVWTTLLVLLCAAPSVGGLTGLLTVVVTLDTLLFVVLLVVSLRSRTS